MNSKEALKLLLSDIKFIWIKQLIKDKFYTPQDLINIIKQDLDRLEKYDKFLNQHCGNCVNKEKNICLGMNAPIGIETLIDCKELMISDCKISLEEQNKKIEKLENVIKKSIELLSIDGKGTKQQVINLLKEVLENEC